MNDCYHVCTNGLAKNLWFYDEGDYVCGMNSIPVCALVCDVKVLCFTLMSNHVHFIIRGRENSCNRFIWEYKRLRSRQLMMKYERQKTIVGSGVFIRRLVGDDEIKSAIAYVMRNPFGAGFRKMLSEYRWGSSGLYFSDNPAGRFRFEKIGGMTERRKREMFRTRVHLPDDYLVDDRGIIFPGNYVDYKKVEELFRSPRSMLYFLSRSKDMEEELEVGVLAKVRYNDAELVSSVEGVCAERFLGKTVSMLTIEDKYRLAKELRRRYGVGPKQLSRVLSLDYDTLKIMLL